MTDQYELDPTDGKSCTKGCFIDIAKNPTVTQSRTLKLREVKVLDKNANRLYGAQISYQFIAPDGTSITATSGHDADLCKDNSVVPTSDLTNYCEASSTNAAGKPGPILRMRYACALGLSQIQVYTARKGTGAGNDAPHPDIADFQVVVHWRDAPDPDEVKFLSTAAWGYTFNFSSALYV